MLKVSLLSRMRVTHLKEEEVAEAEAVVDGEATEAEKEATLEEEEIEAIEEEVRDLKEKVKSLLKGSRSTKKMTTLIKMFKVKQSNEDLISEKLKELEN